MCIKYEASSEKDMHKSGWMVPPRPNVPRDESKPSEEELERRMSMLLPIKSPDRGIGKMREETTLGSYFRLEFYERFIYIRGSKAE